MSTLEPEGLDIYDSESLTRLFDDPQEPLFLDDFPPEEVDKVPVEETQVESPWLVMVVEDTFGEVGFK